MNVAGASGTPFVVVNLASGRSTENSEPEFQARSSKTCLARSNCTGFALTIDRAFKMEEIREAMTYLKSGQHFGKIVLIVGES
jgi:hypothetical protein